MTMDLSLYLLHNSVSKIAPKVTTFNLRYDHRLGNLWLRGTWGRASPRGFRDRGCPTYGMMLGFTQSIYKRVSLKSVGSIVVDRDSLLPFNPTYVLSNVNTP